MLIVMLSGGDLLFSQRKRHLGNFKSSSNLMSSLFFNFRSDECGRVFVYHPNGTRFEKDHVQIYDRSGRKTVPVWGCFSAEGSGPLIQIHGRFTGQQYVEILENHLLPWAIERFFPNFPYKLVQDKSPIHTSIVAKTWFRQHPEFQLLPWPSNGADLNPIENVWGDIVKDFDARDATNSLQVFAKATELWASYDRRPGYWERLSDSMVSRLDLCCQAEGHWTKY
jgi:hypothetical protein